MDQVKLIVVGGNAEAPEIELSLPAVFGRGREATVTLPHPLVSRRHCEVFERDGVLFVRDLGSLNGTFVGSERVTEAKLSPGELLTVGTVTFRAVYGGYVHNPGMESSVKETVNTGGAGAKAPDSAETVPVPKGMVPKPKIVQRKATDVKLAEAADD